MANNLRRIGARLVLLLAVLAVAASAAPINTSIGGTYSLSTATAANWTILGTGVAGVAVAVTANPADISFSSTEAPTTAQTNAGYTGFWEAQLVFNLPSGAFAPTLVFSGLNADDRVVLELNGGQIGNTGIGSGTGLMALSQGAVPSTFTFTGVGAGSAVTITSGFVTGLNYLTLIVNNTESGIQGGLNPSGNTDVGIMSAQLTLTSPVPEPASLSYLLFGLVPLAVGIARRRSR